MTGAPASRSAVRFADAGLSGILWGTPPVGAVLLHGGLLHAHAWDRVLAQSSFSAIALDLPGHGQSDWRKDGDYASTRTSEQLAAWWTSTDRIATRSVLVGHSRGALVAVHLAARIPERISHLVLVDADPTRPRPDARARPRMRHTGTFDELVEDAIGMRPDLDRERVADGVRRGAVQGADGTWSWRWDPRIRDLPIGGGLIDGDTAALAEVTCPVTIVRGRESRAVGEESLARIGEVLGREVVVHTVPGGHNPHSEAPEALALVLREVVGTGTG